MAPKKKLPELNPLFQKFERKAPEPFKNKKNIWITQNFIKKWGGSCGEWGGGIVDITGLIDEGTGITITGTGTSGDPYIISASGGAGLGDVVWPASATNNNIAVFDWITGKLIKDGGATIASKENAITGWTTSQYRRGDKTFVDFATDVRGSILSGISFVTWTAITAADSVLTAFWKLQKQITDNLSTLTTHTSNTSNPHWVTQSQVGLWNVSNTSDATKNSAVATLVNKTINLTSNIFTGTKAQFDTAVSDGNICYDWDSVTNLTMSSARLLGRSTASTGAVEEITVGSGLTLVAGNLTATGWGTWDVVWPLTAVDNNIAVFDLTTGKVIKDWGVPIASLVLGNSSITWATKTKITYDAKGLVTAGADATTADIADSTNKRYVTDANLTTIGNQSGTNTGDNAVNSLYSGLSASKENTITGTTSADFWSWAKTFINFATTVRATVLTGLSLASSTVISASDTLLVALGSLQKQISDVVTAIALKANIASPTFTGVVTLPTTQLWEASLKLDAVLSANNTRSGITIAGTAGATLAVGDLCMLNSSGNWVLSDGILDGTDTSFKSMIWFCVLASTNTNPTEILTYWVIRSTLIPTLTIGAPVYMHDTAGDVIVARPSTTNFAVRIVWYASTTTELFVNPSNDYIVNT